MHSYCNNCVYLHTFAKTSVGFFWLKCAKLSTFCILQNFAIANVVAVRMPNVKLMLSLIFTLMVPILI